MNLKSTASAEKQGGKLRIYFGATNGVGKTYAMLQAARQQQMLGRKVLFDIVAVQATEVLALQTELLALSGQAGSDGESLPDFQGVLKAPPDLLVIDELAQRNYVLPEEKAQPNTARWQDVRELLSAGIDVYTTVNVQDLEGLHAAVTAITGAAVNATIPDGMFDNADEVILVDLPVDELIARFQAGKLRGGSDAVPQLRKGHLMALRDLAIRRHADRNNGENQVAKIVRRPKADKSAILSKTTSTPVSAGRKRYAWAVAAILATVLIALPLRPYLDPANSALLLLLGVFAVAMRLGRGPALLASVLAALSFDFLFVSPRYSFWIDDWQYLLTLVLVLVAGVMAAKLTADISVQAGVAGYRELRANALNEFARALSAALQTEQIFDICRNFIEDAFQAKASLLLPNAEGRLQYPAVFGPEYDNVVNMSALDMETAQWSFDHAELTGPTNDVQSGILYLPLVAPMRTRGILAIQADVRHWMQVPEQRKHLDTFAALAAIALERVHYVDVAQDALVRMESERLRNSLLSALSHDLRTPLTSLVGLSEALSLSKPALDPQQHELAMALRDEALRMSRLVNNLLDMARIESGEVKLNLQWQAIQEVTGSAVRACKLSLGRHQIQVSMGEQIPLLRYDAVLLERVLCNLLENASKYTPSGTIITIAAEVADGMLVVSVADDGPGLPAGREEAIFEKFARGERESAQPGMGLGLSICRAIIAAHGGRMLARQAQQGGACFEFYLPLGTAEDLHALAAIEME
ncbi:ATP-binding protein [Undibacterium sp. TJN19]|uniref:ATP-binding protein n=1 Tax=Undibacterium sp. TJN19 TaxID=3413055 RepID=UPI003BF163E3